MLNIAVLCSHRAPGLLHLLNRDPARGTVFDIACVVTSELTFAEELGAERRGVPTRSHSIRDFHAARSASVYRDRQLRADYDAETVEILAPFRPDLVVLDGYLYLVTGPMLAAYPGRLLNLHFSDLTLRDVDGDPIFPGVRALRDTLRAGCRTTRATVHLVDAQADHGAPLVVSRPFPVSPMVQDARGLCAVDMFNAYAFAHEQWMMKTASGPLLSAALALVASGDLALDDLARADPAGVSPWELAPDGSVCAPGGLAPAALERR